MFWIIDMGRKIIQSIVGSSFGWYIVVLLHLVVCSVIFL